MNQRITLGVHEIKLVGPAEIAELVQRLRTQRDGRLYVVLRTRIT